MQHLPHDINALGLRCPLPALRLAKAVREKGAGTFRLQADDPAAASDIPALCSERGWQLLETGPEWFLVRA